MYRPRCPFHFHSVESRNANLLIGGVSFANREIGVPAETAD